MSATHNPKDYIAPYEFMDDWDEVLLGDEELFKEMTEPYIPSLLAASKSHIKRDLKLSNLLQPEELVSETLIQAWQMRYGRNKRTPMKDWLLQVEKHTFYMLAGKEKLRYEPYALSLEAFVPSQSAHSNQNECWESMEPQMRERWSDIIPDNHIRRMVI